MGSWRRQNQLTIEIANSWFSPHICEVPHSQTSSHHLTADAHLASRWGLTGICKYRFKNMNEVLGPMRGTIKPATMWESLHLSSEKKKKQSLLQQELLVRIFLNIAFFFSSPQNDNFCTFLKQHLLEEEIIRDRVFVCLFLSFSRSLVLEEPRLWELEIVRWVGVIC